MGYGLNSAATAGFAFALAIRTQLFGASDPRTLEVLGQVKAICTLGYAVACRLAAGAMTAAQAFEAASADTMSLATTSAPAAPPVASGAAAAAPPAASSSSQRHLADVLFASRSADLTAETRATLDGVVQKLSGSPTMKLRIEGHTDNTLNDDETFDLSRHRIVAVRRYLIERGIGEHRLSNMPLGKGHPVAPNDTAAGRAAHNRVSLQIE